MGYVALLFCPDEKTARTVTQVLSELEFSVEACLEPFAAVKKLMGEHFDAVVVDCDNEQNATLLFKSARNSTSNQTSLAVAVVEGQAGVAKAFRIGANLVLTKPINIEQAKGTLRVARGLLRKADPAKPGAPAIAAAPSAPAPAAATPKPAPKPVMAAKPVAPAAPKPAATAPPVAKQIPVPKPAVSAPAWPAAAAATSAVPTVQGGDLVEKPAAKVVPAAIPEPAAPKPEPVLPKVEKVPEATAPVAHHVPSPISFSSAGAASAPAPAREPQVHSTVEVPAKPAEPAVSEPASAAASALMFSYGGSAEPASSGGKKKIFIGVAAAVVIAGAAYFGWTQYQAHSAGSASTQAPDAQTATVTQPAVAQPPTPTSVTPAAAPAENVNKTSTANAGTENSEPVSKESAPKETAHPAPSTKPSASSTTSKPAAAEKQEEQPEPAPLMVKSGKEPAQPKSAAADVSAPSMIGMATPASAPPPELVREHHERFHAEASSDEHLAGRIAGTLVQEGISGVSAGCHAYED